MDCPKCGTTIVSGAKFCFSCGAKIDDSVSCPKCKIKLPSGAKFCFHCGTKLKKTNVNKTPASVPQKRKNVPLTKKMSIYSYPIIVPVDEVAIYLVIDNISKTAGDAALQAYKKYGSLESVIAGFPKLAEALYDGIAKTMLELLAKHFNRYEVSEEDILRGSCDVMTGLADFYKALCQAYNKFTGEKRSEELHREMRKQSRFQVVGGGFGISGAVKGMIIAEGANFATGMLHSIYNCFDGMITDSRIDDAMDDCYKEGAKRLKEALSIDVKQIVLFVASRYFWPGHVFQINENDRNRSRSIVKSINAGRVPQNEVTHQIAEAIKADITNTDLMCWAYNRLGDPKGELKAIAEELQYEDVLKHIEYAENIKKAIGSFTAEIRQKFATDKYLSSILDDLNKPLPELLLLMFKRVSLKEFYIKHHFDKILLFDDSNFIQKWESALSTIPFFCSIEKTETPLLVFWDSTLQYGNFGFMLTDKSFYTPFRRYDLKQLDKIEVSVEDSEFDWHSICLDGVESCSGSEGTGISFTKELCTLLDRYLYLFKHIPLEQTPCIISESQYYGLHQTAEQIGTKYASFNSTWRTVLSTVAEKAVQATIRYYLDNKFFDRQFVNNERQIYLNDGSNESREQIEFAMKHLTCGKELSPDEYPVATFYQNEEGFFTKKLQHGFFMTTKKIYLLLSVDKDNTIHFQIKELKDINSIYPSSSEDTSYGGKYSICFVDYTSHYVAYDFYAYRRKYADILCLLNWIFNESNQLQFNDEYCGNKFQAEWFCGQCGTKNNADANFCGKCGTRKGDKEAKAAGCV